MGLSARYHVASLLAVFLALAVGILIGVGLGGTVSERRLSLESSLDEDLAEARRERDAARRERDAQLELGQTVLPLLVEGRLADDQVGVLALGDPPQSLLRQVERAIDPTAGRLAQVAVVDLPLDVERLTAVLAGSSFDELDSEPGQLEELGAELGRELVRGGQTLDRLRRSGRLFSRASGRFDGVDALVVARQLPEGLPPEQLRQLERFEQGLLSQIAESGLPAVGVGSTEEPEQVAELAEAGLSTVDNVDTPAGKLALIGALAGAEGSFGQGPEADRLLPELLPPPPRGER